MNKAIDAIDRIENLANRSAYDYTPKQVEVMFKSVALHIQDSEMTELMEQVTGKLKAMSDEEFAGTVLEAAE